MTIFQFAPDIQKGIAEGIFQQVVSNGVPIGLARMAQGAENGTGGQFVAHAIGLAGQAGGTVNPVFAAAQLALEAPKMYQIHRGFQAVQVGLQTIQASLGVLQTMTMLTGVGVAANLAISAFSLWQILKLREDVKHQRLEIREGFLDLKQALKDLGADHQQQLEEAVQTIELSQHHQALAQAYGRFMEATRLMAIAMSCQDLNIRNSDLANARQILVEALADYKNPQLLPDADAVTRLRRAECVWTIEQTIALSYQLQNQPEALSNCLKQLQNQVRQDALTVIHSCETEDELGVIFPELTRIHEQDLVVLKVWQEQVDWMRSCAPSEREQLQNADLLGSTGLESAIEPSPSIPPEELLYQMLKQRSHFSALQNALQFMVQPEARQDYENYISQQAEGVGRTALVAANLQQMTNLSLANLYWYFQVRDESELDPVADKRLPVA